MGWMEYECLCCKQLTFRRNFYHIFQFGKPKLPAEKKRGKENTSDIQHSVSNTVTISRGLRSTDRLVFKVGEGNSPLILCGLLC